MPSPSQALLQSLPQLAFAFVLVLARVGCTCMLLPAIGEAEVPGPVRAGFAVAATLLLLPVLLPMLPAAPSQPLEAAAIVAAEILTGLWLGWLTRLVLNALTTAGQVAALLVGQSSVLQQDPALGASTAALGRLMSVAGPVLLLTSGLYATPLLALMGSYSVIAPGALLPASDTALGVIAAVGTMFALAVQLVAPFILASLGWHLSVALVGRLVPQMSMHLMTLAAPAQLLLGLIMLGLLIAALLAAWQQHATDLFAVLPGI